MPLSATSRLGPYEIRSILGVGGMGAVYRAHDPRLNRDVAIKVLGQIADVDGTSRFEREARTLAALNHPNLVAVYDFGVQDGQQYIVQEFIEGESLRSLLTGKPVPMRKLLELATQIADGLAAAHAAGIVHRDLKPENIMLGKDGRARIVDFGLARHRSPLTTVNEDGGSSLDATATLAYSSPEPECLTRPGMILGTPSYMNPEQALGQPTDFRSDQFSFGLILYELACGKRAFGRQSSIETVAAIVREPVPPMEERVPVPLRWIVNRCLAKEPDLRYESTRDLYRDLSNLRDHLSEISFAGGVAPVAPQPDRYRWRIAAIFAGCMLVAGLLAYFVKPTGQNIGTYRYTSFAIDTDRAVWSPNGTAVAYASRVNGVLQVFLRYLNSPVPVQLTHETLDTVPFGWSSDRSHLIVGENTPHDFGYAHYRLQSVPTVGGPLEPIMEVDCYTCDLSRDGKVFATLSNAGIEISDPIGSPLHHYQSDPFREFSASPWLTFSPNGKSILLIIPVASGKPNQTWLLPYPNTGRPPRQIPLLGKFPSGFAMASWMPDSQHLVMSVPDDQTATNHLWMADAKSNHVRPLTTGIDQEYNPFVSPDGNSILYSIATQRVDLTSVSTEDGTTRTLVTSGHYEGEGAWSARQAKLAWISDRSGSKEIWVRLADGSDHPAITAADFEAKSDFFMPSLSPADDRIVFGESSRTNNQRLWISSLAGGAPVSLTNDNGDREFGGSWSPDGSRFVFLRVKDKKWALLIVKTSGNATPTILKENVWGLPDWSPTGDWIAYRDSKGWWLVAPDGKNARYLGKIQTDSLSFSKDGKLLYGIKTGDTEGQVDRATLFSLDPVTLRQKVIRELGKELAPKSFSNFGIQFSLAPDGRSFVYPTAYYREDLWMLRGYRQPGWWDQIADALNRK